MHANGQHPNRFSKRCCCCFFLFLMTQMSILFPRTHMSPTHGTKRGDACEEIEKEIKGVINMIQNTQHNNTLSN